MEPQPLSIQSRLQQALALHHLGRLAEARAIYEAILREHPAHFDASYLRATAMLGQGDAHGALAAFDAALALNGAHPMAHANRAGCLMQLGRWAEAVAAFDRALQLQPGYAAAWLRRAMALQQMGDARAALESAGRALALQPDLPGAASLATQLRAQLGVEAGEPSAQPARADVRPSDEENRRAAAEYLGKLGELARAQQGAAAGASSWMQHMQAGRLLAGLQQFAQAADEFEQALAAGAPRHMLVRGSLLEAVRAGVLWKRLPALHAAVEEDLARGVSSVSPLTWQLESDDAASQLRCSKLHALANAPSAIATRPPLPPTAADGRIRVAYLSADFAQHPVMRQLAEVFELHDRSAFEIHAWAWGEHTGDGMNARCARAIEHFHDARQMTDAQVAAQMRAAGIDIAIDLMGYTEGARSGILALRPAPVAVNFLGYPGSSALDFIDYIVADATLIPPELECHYSERVLRLPGCYLPTDRQRPVGTPPAREAQGLPEGAFVFCAHSHPRKISPHVFAIWMRLLAQVAGSVLWLLQDSEEATARLREAAAAAGIAPERLVFAARTRYEDYLARYACADLFLDTSPYSALATMTDALWAGLPAITCTGQTYVARGASSILRAAGLPQLVQGDWRGYEDCALRLAHQPQELAALRAQLIATRCTSTLGDTPAYMRALEALWTYAVQRAREGLEPQNFDVQA